MRTSARATVAAGLITALGAVALPASGAWITPNGSGTGTAGATAVNPPINPAAAPTVGSAHNSITISWQAPAGPTPTGYRVDRTTPAGTGVCTPSFTVGTSTWSCSDSGLTAGTPYEYKVYALLQRWNSTAASKSATPVAATTAFFLKQDIDANATTGADTEPSGRMPLSAVAPPTRNLANYDSQRDPGVGNGLRILAGGSLATSDATKIQRWFVPRSTSLSGNVKVRLWSSLKDSASAIKNGNVTVGLYRCNGNGNTCGTAALATKTVFSTTNWAAERIDTGTSTWVEREWDLGTIPLTAFSTNDSLEIRVVVANEDMWFAYDTAAYPSRLILP
ncbi:MAG: hypothetical protein JWQ59_1438 [Cryobacterium sp.]|nr:hypothetical protein [Cryobacterium sp.]